MMLELIILTVICLIVGYSIGVAQNGLHININKHNHGVVQPEPETLVYNDTNEDLLPEEVQSYYTQNQGYTK